MTDMTFNLQQAQTVQQTQNTNQPKADNSKAAEGESFSEKLDRAVKENAGAAQTQQNNSEEAEKAGAQMAAEAAAVIVPPMIPIADNTGEAALNAAQNTETPIEALPDAAALAEPQQQAEISVEQPQAPIIEDNAKAVMQTSDTAAPEISEQPQTVETTPAPEISAEAAEADEAEAQPMEHFKAQTQFRKSVEQAQHLIRNTDSASSQRSAPLKIDVDELQKKVDAGEYLAQTQLQRQPVQTEQINTEQYSLPENVEPKEVFSQIKTAADAHAAQNDSDFVIKLRPEGLGEITVKLASQDGRTTLSLSASDANVQKMLGGEINTLREIMRPYNVEVAQVEQSNSAVYADLQQQLQQQQSSQQQSGNQQSRMYAVDYADAPEEQEISQPQQPDAILDQYI